MHQDMFRGFDDFFSSGFGGTGGVGGMNGFGATSGGFSSFSSSSMTIGPDGVPRTVSRTERTVVNPDGTRETKARAGRDTIREKTLLSVENTLPQTIFYLCRTLYVRLFLSGHF